MIESSITFLPVSNLKEIRPLLYRGVRADSLERDGQLYYFKLQQRILGILPV